VRVLAVELAREPRGVPAYEPLALPVFFNTGIPVCRSAGVLAVELVAGSEVEPSRWLRETGDEGLGDRRDVGAIHFTEAKVDTSRDMLTGGSTGGPMVPYASFRNNVERKPPWRKARTRRQTSAMMKMTASEM